VLRDLHRRDVGERPPLSEDAAFEAWRERRRAGDESATLLNLYELVARPRGLEPHELPLEERNRLSTRALYEMAPGFEIIPGSDRGVEPIELVPYDPRWPAQFDLWRARLLGVLPSAARRIDHVGSTAVPGLAAKPVIDIQVSVEDLSNEAAYVPAIESLDVQLRSRDDEHRFFRPFAGRARDVHIHVCSAASEWERRHLLFVAYLRADAAARDAYLQAKLAAAARWSDDRIAYTEAKDEIIREITARAEMWEAQAGPSS
jgi:GrpB-like predicted nucleotidyltransferase (UPF0157 family)